MNATEILLDPQKLSNCLLWCYQKTMRQMVNPSMTFDEWLVAVNEEMQNRMKNNGENIS